ncbi:UDP-3-O-(3-hydroxymyristoyl)glucosamine N-acyltransferase [Flavicella sp.]|uniref:UDP-3-O-(3-hydroxymyristoyl)glucosamine N-acyltransferase n=1 Tax=Flavicella sp. TaxID=2957742 RepID=UPI0026350761|nr:UDP-3-O-(3-hydroxymyristoyl)glucosamine N-acyltransferase [Flavicella sp.]MDG1805290.1 UDP-3-O-(3-hydroxymyristoyl)glucosamine N-acyltransferase [Flavicella sp.]MDG2279261.1 UDP-3-O-(3-hydroxymyristoyl)glucosamine N-acyltransferase [Flavicella sp.]
MKFTATQIAELLEGDIVGDPNVEVSKLAKIEEGTEGALTFLSNEKYTSYIYTTNASLAIVNKSFEPTKKISATLIKVDDAYAAFTKLLTFYNEVKQNKTGKEEPHFISDSAEIGINIYLGAFAYIGNNVKIGDDVKIYPHCYIGDNVTIESGTTLFSGVKVYSDCKIGNNCKIHAGAIIGADGFGFAPDENKVYTAIPQIGNVIIEDNVDIGANTTIDRATLGSTIIRKGVKLDNLIQIAHNCEIDENTVIAAQTGISGSTKIGKRTMIGGQAAFAGHIKIGDDVVVSGFSGVRKNVKDKDIVIGFPAYNIQKWNKSSAIVRNLPSYVEKINELEKEIKALKEK